MAALGLCQRVTCNPLLIKATGLPVNAETAQQLYAEALAIGLEELHLQTWPDPSGDWYPVAKTLADMGDSVVVKFPAVASAMPAARRLRLNGHRVLITAVSNSLHALWAAEIGADFVAPYVGRLSEAGQDAFALVDQLVALQNQGGPKLLAASVRDLSVLGRLIGAGAYGITVQKALMATGINDAQALEAVAQFEAARKAG